MHGNRNNPKETLTSAIPAGEDPSASSPQQGSFIQGRRLAFWHLATSMWSLKFSISNLTVLLSVGHLSSILEAKGYK